MAQIQERLDWHSIYQKAMDETLFLDRMDIWTPIPGAEDMTIGQYLHNLINADKKPLFRHILHKWSPNALDNVWENTARPNMVSEAITVLTALRSTLVSTYGNDIITLFPTKETGMDSNNQSAPNFKNKRSAYSKNVDVKIEQMLTDAESSEIF